MANVFKGLELETQRPVVIKVPLSEYEGSRSGGSRFAREAAILGKLDHPGILKVIPVPAKSRTYVAMEYLEGETLAGILHRAGPMPECQALQLGSRLCGILEYVHRQGVVHCDVKPGNIIISDDGSPHLIDFGVAKAPGWWPPNMGTLEYMAPEQIEGDRIDGRADIYSLGIVTYEIVTGTRPSQEKTRPPRELNPKLSPQIEEIILHAMAPDPSDRYPSAAAMKVDFDSPEKVRITGKYRNPRKLSPWPKRLRIAAIVAALAVFPILLFFLFLLMFQRQLAR